MNADDYNDSPVIKTLILLWQAVADPKICKEDAERVFEPVFNGDEFEQWNDVLSYCIIYWVEALETRGIHLTADEVFSLVDRIKDGNLRKEVRMFADIYASGTINKMKAEVEQAREGEAQALARERAAEKLAAQYQRELQETRQQMTQRQDNVFWIVLSARFPAMPITVSSRISQVDDYSQKLLGDVMAATTIEDFNARLDSYLATP